MVKAQMTDREASTFKHPFASFCEAVVGSPRCFRTTGPGLETILSNADSWSAMVADTFALGHGGPSEVGER